MGANNSAPQTARIENPERGIAVQLSPSVVLRLENSRKRDDEKPNVKTLENESVDVLRNLEGQEQQKKFQQQQEHQQHCEAESQQQAEQYGQEEPREQPQQQGQQEYKQQPYKEKEKSYGQQSQEQSSNEQLPYQHPHTHNLNQRRDRENRSHENNDLLDDKCNEHKNHQFEKTMEKLESYLGKPTHWSNTIDWEILELRSELIACHREHPGEPLCCAELAKKYQDLIFREQFLSILRFNRKTDEEERDREQRQHDKPEEQPEEVNYFSERN